MNLKTTLLAGCILLSSPLIATECEVAYQDASYGFQHAETAMEANNIEQLKQYANRSKVAIAKVLRSTETCGCQEANTASYDALENLDKALNKGTFESVRFYVNRAKTHAKNILIALDSCSANDASYALLQEEEDLLAQEKALKEQQQKLLEQQQKLKDQLEAQRLLQAEIKLQKQDMMSLQKEVRSVSESTLSEMQVLINDFTEIMGCKDASALTDASFERKLEELEQESLKATKIFYAEKAKEMANNLLNRLESCEWKN